MIGAAAVPALTPDRDDFYLTPAEVAARWRIAVETLANNRARGDGIPYVKLHGRVLYRLADVLEAEEAGSRGLTWHGIVDALARYDGLTDRARERLLEHLQRTLIAGDTTRA